MKKIFIIGGMGAGKSIARCVLSDQGVPFIDLDEIGHQILGWDTVRTELVEAFGSDIVDSSGAVVRKKLAACAFARSVQTHKLNRITMPRIEELFTEQVRRYEKEGSKYLCVEYSAFKNRHGSLAFDAAVIVAVLAPLDVRIARAISAGWDERDVRQRIAQQISDVERRRAADVTFDNRGSVQDLKDHVVVWWKEYTGHLQKRYGTR